jgi:TolB-like protein/Tfp pilus assembly protein PilF
MVRSLFAELRRRNVLRAAVLYVGAVWALTQGIAQLAPVVGAPEWAARWFLVAAAIGFPFWIAFAWFYEFTPEGLKRESEIVPAESITAHTGRKLDRWIFAVMGLAIVLLLTDRFVLRHGVNEHGAPGTPEKSIAVLPFVDMSQARDQEYFSDGISEELLNLLARIPSLQVTARTSSFSFKGKEIAIPEIAKSLHVAHILEGSVRKAGTQVRITAQLIDALHDKHLWSQTYDRKLDDVFAIQDEIAADVVKALKVTLLGEAPKVRATTPEAYALFLSSKEKARADTPEAYDASDAMLRRALELDPGYLPARAALARNIINRTVGLEPSPERDRLLAEARKLIDDVLAVDPDFARAHELLGYIAISCCDDIPGAVPHYQRALALDPRDTTLLGNSVIPLVALGRFEQAIGVSEAVLRLDPVNVARMHNLGALQKAVGRYDDAIRTFRAVLSIVPTRRASRQSLAETLLLNGDAQAALVEFEAIKDPVLDLFYRSMCYHALGRKAESDAALAEFTARFEAEASFQVAEAHAFRGEIDQAYAWLDKAVERNDSGLPGILLARSFEPIRSDPRWLPFLRKLGKAPEQLAKIEFDVKIPATIEDSVASAQAGAKP